MFNSAERKQYRSNIDVLNAAAIGATWRLQNGDVITKILGGRYRWAGRGRVLRFGAYIDQAAFSITLDQLVNASSTGR